MPMREPFWFEVKTPFQLTLKMGDINIAFDGCRQSILYVQKYNTIKLNYL